MDIMTPAQRSSRMRLISAKNTKPEVIVRSLLHSLGYRYRLHTRGLPGKPDIVFALRKKVIFVHGCLWHGHAGCRLNRPPKSRLDYWVPKLARNKTRDEQHIAELENAGWSTLIVWECETEQKDLSHLAERLKSFLGPSRISRQEV